MTLLAYLTGLLLGFAIRHAFYKRETWLERQRRRAFQERGTELLQWTEQDHRKALVHRIVDRLLQQPTERLEAWDQTLENRRDGRLM